MKPISPLLRRLAAVALLNFAPSLPAQPVPFLIEPTAPAPSMRLIWQTEPGVRYDLFQSTDLLSWTHVPGYPAAAVGLSKEYSFNLGPRGFFRIVPIDEQPPVVVEQFPAVDGFAVGRFADFTIRLADPSGINPASIRLTVGANGPLAVGAPGLFFSGGVFTYDSGALPLGTFGQTVPATLIVADTLGNTLTHTWSFKLEPAAQVTGNVFVFGSPPAQSAGQSIAGPTAALASRLAAGPVKKIAGASAWSIESVAADRIVIAYGAGSPPSFSIGQLLCNLTPVKIQEIFYRCVLSVADDPGTSRLTVFTEDIPLTALVQNGSSSITAESVVYDTAPDGTLLLPAAFSGTITFPRIGFDLSGSELKLRPDGYEATVLGVTSSFGDEPPWIDIEATEWSWWFTPRLRVSLEIGLGGLKSFEAVASGDLSLNNEFNVDVLLTGLSTETTVFDLPKHLEPKHVIYMGQIGLVPVYGLLAFDLKVKTKAEAQAVIDYSFNYRQDISVYFGFTYHQSSGLDWVKGFQASSPDLDADVALTGKFSLEVRLVPEPQFLVYGLAGFLVNIEPHAGISVEAGTGGFDGKLDAGLDFTLAPAGPAFAFLPVGTELSFPIWEGEWPLVLETLAFTSHPQTRTVATGADTSFTCTVDSSALASFQWFQNGTPIPGQISRTMFLPRVGTGHAGSYFARATAGSATADSNSATLTVQVPIPANTDTDNDGLSNSVETNTGVWLSASNTGTNPNQWDTDGDGLRDGVETHTGVFVSASNTGTDPLDPDTDNDGVNDKGEITAGTDPNIIPVPVGSVRWEPSAGGNGHYYYLVAAPAPVTWESARDAASAIGGYLATYTSGAENTFVRNLAGTFRLWAGAYQPAGSNEPAGGWRWVTNEPFVYTNWETLEPNNAGGAEDRMVMRPNGRWNDLNGSQDTNIHYVVEFGPPE